MHFGFAAVTHKATKTVNMASGGHVLFSIAFHKNSHILKNSNSREPYDFL
jgi:hypothetical protein